MYNNKVRKRVLKINVKQFRKVDVLQVWAWIFPKYSEPKSQIYMLTFLDGLAAMFLGYKTSKNTPYIQNKILNNKYIKVVLFGVWLKWLPQQQLILNQT